VCIFRTWFEATKVKGEHGAALLIEGLMLLDHLNNTMRIFNQFRL